MTRDANVHKTAGRAAAADTAAAVVDVAATSAAMDSAVVPPARSAEADPPLVQTPEAAQVDAGTVEGDVTPEQQSLLEAVAEIKAAGVSESLPKVGQYFGELVMLDLEVTAMVHRRRRAGRAFGLQPTVIPGSEVTEELLAELDGDPLLKLRPVSAAGP